jgi:hypothetical protein
MTGSISSTRDLDIVIEVEHLSPSPSGKVCSLDGTLRNTGEFVDSVRIDFDAINFSHARVASSIVVEFSIDRNERRPFSSSYFSPEIPCSSISGVERRSTRVTRLND